MSVGKYLDHHLSAGYEDAQRDGRVSVPDASASPDSPKGSLLSSTLPRPHDPEDENEKSFVGDTSTTTAERRRWEVDATESASTTCSDSESGASSSRGGRLFGERLASTKPSSLEEETNHTRGRGAGKQKVENFYSHTEAADSRPDDDDDIRSLASEPEDIQSQDGSGTASWTVTTAAVSYLAEVLTEDPDLAPLYLDAARRLEDHRFSRNHGRLLKRYYLSLRSRGPNQKQRAAIEFLRPRSHRALISGRVLEKLRSRDRAERERVHVALPQDEERDLTLQRYLKNDDSSTDGEDHRGIGALVDLEETRSFFVSGVPMARLRAELRDLLNLGPGRFLRWGEKLSAWVFDLCSPPKPGYQRVSMFLDVRELSPGGLGRFRERLARDGLAKFPAAQGSTTDVPSALAPPPAAHLRSERSPSTASLQRSDLESSSFATRPPASSTSSWSEEPAPREEPSGFQYLLVCVNQKSLPMLVHIECGSFENDQYLCREILENYRMIREGATWKTSFLVPLSIAAVMNGVSEFLEQRTPGRLRWMSRLFRSLSDISFFQMDSGDFVRFQLVPVGEAVVPNHFKCGEFPPCSQVEAGNYMYEPVPMADVALASIPLWHLTRPGRHSDKYWITTFPKKLRHPLRREAGVYGRPVVGWGIRVNERFNWRQFLFLILAVIVVIGAVMGAYLALRADDSSGFGLAAFLAAVAAIYIPYQYFAWKEKLDC
ncbi:hypothetical protein LY76DRAFT_682354 [Colletotrichum caudatum]|nr:hypothetical protein LY76DRAFT_682354 [Colletotrichum caudatum]